jgi:glycosyltransferase involved in cell wall biosynthesis
MKLLVVTFHFPPDASVGGMRWQKFVKFLPHCGWTPLILTVEPRYYEALDVSRLDDVRSATIHRTRVLPNARAVANAVRTRLFGHRGAADACGASTPLAPAHVTRLRRWLFSLFWLPDDELGWFPPAVARGLTICRRERVDAIVTSGPPHTSHLVGLALKRVTGIRWIADFRDPWTGNPQKPWFVRSALSDFADRLLENAVVAAADTILATTHRLRERLVETYAHQPRGKFVTITNGFDADDFAGPFAQSNRRHTVRPFTITHAGTIYGTRSADAVLDGIARLLDGGGVPRHDLRLVFAGHVGNRDAFDARVEALGLGGVVEFRGRLSYGDAIGTLRDSDTLLLLAQDHLEQIPAKTFDYIAAGKEILAVAEPGAVADLVAQVGGRVVPNDSHEIAAAIATAYAASANSSRLTRRAGAVSLAARYDRRVLTKELVTLLSVPSV